MTGYQHLGFAREPPDGSPWSWRGLFNEKLGNDLPWDAFPWWRGFGDVLPYGAMTTVRSEPLCSASYTLKLQYFCEYPGSGPFRPVNDTFVRPEDVFVNEEHNGYELLQCAGRCRTSAVCHAFTYSQSLKHCLIHWYALPLYRIPDPKYIMYENV